MVQQADNTLTRIRQLVRRLTASASESSLTTDEIDKTINDFYSNDFPYGIKMDQMRAVYTFFTEPYRDRYPLDVNYNQGVRSPVYFEGIAGTLFKERSQFYNVWPRFPTKFQQGGTSISGTITGIAQPTNPTQITSTAHNLSNFAVIQINNVGGMTQLNGNFYTITVIDANNFSLNGVDNTAFGGYTGGGDWIGVSQTFSFIIPGPFLSKEVVIGGVNTIDGPISINDDGNGNLVYYVPNAVVSNPIATTNPAVPGMYNLNTMNPGLKNPSNIGTVNYVTGQIDFTLPTGVSLGIGELLTVWVSQYQTGRPYYLMFWNNEFTIRPVPKLIHKVEVEVYLTPVQFMQASDVPILNQWAKYISYGSAMEILRQRQDSDGVEGLREGFMRQEALVLERQTVEELFVPTITLFNTSSPALGGVGGIGYFV